MKTNLLLTITSLIFLIGARVTSFAASVDLQWLPNSETDIAGYRVYYKADSAVSPLNGIGAVEGDSPIDVQNMTKATIDGLDPGRTYYFAVTAYNTSGLESAYSDIIPKVPPLPDTIAPAISAFTIPSTSTSLTVPLTSFIASDNVAVAGYLLTQSATPIPALTDAGWTVTAPTSYTFNAAGTMTAYAWAKDAAGNLSNGVGKSVTITTQDSTAPVVNAFALPATSTSLTVPVTSFTASDTVGVTGYLITESATTPAASASGWTASAPTSFTFSAAGTKTAYAWAKDAAGNVSASRSATLTITLDTASLTNTLGQYNALTLNDKETITGTVNKSATLSVQVGSAAPLPVPVSPQGTWSYEVPNLVQGNNTIKATAVDAAGKVTTTNITIKKLVSGDVNGDGMVDLRDVLIVLQAAVGAIQPTPEALVAGAVADVGTQPATSGISAAGNRKLNIRDAMGLLKIAVGNKGT